MKIQMPRKLVLFFRSPGLPGVIGLMILMWGIYWLCVAPVGATIGWFPRWEEAGQFGDSFGGLTCLFSAITLAVLLFGLYKEGKQRADQSRIAAVKEIVEMAERRYERTRDRADLFRAEVYAQRLAALLFKDELSDEKVIYLFKKYTATKDDHFTKASLERFRILAVQHDVAMYDELEKVLADSEIVEFLVKTYGDQLGRYPDPAAFVTWGSALQKSNKSEEMKAEISVQIMTSPEYQRVASTAPPRSH